MLNTMLGALSSDIAIDLGTAHTRIHARGRGLVCCEPTVLAVEEDRAGRRNIIAFGEEALAMVGRTPPEIHVLQPVQGGVITDYEVAEALLGQLMMEVEGRRLWVGPKAVLCVPPGMTDVEKRALRECAEASGAREVQLVDATLAAAVGVGLPVNEPHGQFLIDVGAGSTQMAIISLGGVVYSRSLRLGGRDLDRAVQAAVEEQQRLVIGLGAAEQLKIDLGSALPGGSPRAAAARGRSKDTGFPAEAVVRSEDVSQAIASAVKTLVGAVVATLERTPPDLAADVAATGVVLTGGGALLQGLDAAIGEATGLPVVVPEDPFVSAVIGAASSRGSLPSGRAIAG